MRFHRVAPVLAGAVLAAGCASPPTTASGLIRAMGGCKIDGFADMSAYAATERSCHTPSGAEYDVATFTSQANMLAWEKADFGGFVCCVQGSDWAAGVYPATAEASPQPLFRAMARANGGHVVEGP